MKKILLLLVFTTLSSLVVSAQQKTISGRVIDYENLPLPGVTITINESTARATQTNDKGEYTVEAQVGEVLTFQFLGMEPVQRTVGEDNTINVSMVGSSQSLQDVVVVGYGTQKRANLTGAVTTIDVEKTFETRPITDVARALQGAAPGLTITSPSGDLGSNPTIRLRGVTGSLNTGSAGASPLILVDNVEVPSLQMVNPDDIQSVSVLKDAASTSIYGTRAAWGVILITTKSGKRNTPNTIRYTNNVAWQKPTETLEIASAAEGAEVAFAALRRTNPNLTSFKAIGTTFDEIAIERMREWEELYGGQNLGLEMVEGRDFETRGGNLYFYRPWDAPGMYMKEYSPQQMHNLTINGGSEKINYNLGLGYLNQGGVLKVNPDKFQRLNMNLGVDATLNSWLSARAKVLYSNSMVDKPYSYNGDTYDPWFYLYRWQKTLPYGTFEGKPFRNAITDVEQARMMEDRSSMTRISLGSTLTPVTGLNVNVDYTYTNFGERDHLVGGAASGWDFWGGTMDYRQYTSASHDRVRYTSFFQDRHVLNVVANYDLNVKEDHEFKFTAGINSELYEGGNHFSQRTELMDPDKGELQLATGVQTANSNAGHWSTLGYFGRVNYSFKNRYLLQASARIDGSSRFPRNDQWATFPSVSAGWIASEEEFLEFARPYLSFLKVRGSYGLIGNQNVGANAFIATMPTSSSSWLIGEAFIPTVGTPGVISPTLTWETVKDLDFGVDMNFFNNNLTFTFDWFKRTTSDMLSAGSTLPSSFGATAPRRNFGEMETKGWEVELGYRHLFENGFSISANGQLSDFRERITKFANATRLISSNYEGRVIGEIWGYETDRFFTDNDFEQDGAGNLLTDDNGHWIPRAGIADQTLYESSWFFYGPGDIKYKDLNGDGIIDRGEGTVESPGDQKIIGNSNPRWQYGLRMDFGYKGFDLGFFLQGVGKRDLWASGTSFIPGFRPGEAWYQHQLDYWTPENPNAFYPRPTDQGQSNSIRNFMPQTKYLLDMSYLRVKNLTFGYTFPEKWVERAKVQNLRIFFSGENLFEFDNVDMPIDPETDYTSWGLNDGNSFGRVYPFKRTYSFGLQLTL